MAISGIGFALLGFRVVTCFIPAMEASVVPETRIDQSLVPALSKHRPNLPCLRGIHETNLAGLLDQPLLAALDIQPRTLLTRDVNSIPDFLKELLREGKTHAGVVYVSSRFRQNDSRAVIRALVTFLKAHGDEDWSCREGWL